MGWALVIHAEAPATGTADRRAYWRAYYLANRDKKIAAAKESYRRRQAEKQRAPKPRRAGAPRFYATRGL